MKRGFDGRGEFRIATLEGWQFLWDMFEIDMDAALAVSPCSAIRVRCNGETFGGQVGQSYDPKVPAINLDMRQVRPL